MDVSAACGAIRLIVPRDRPTLFWHVGCVIRGGCSVLMKSWWLGIAAGLSEASDALPSVAAKDSLAIVA